MNDICKDTGVYLRNSLRGHFFDQPLAEAITDVLEKEEIKSVYDLGCGHGEYTRYLKYNRFACSGFDGNPYTKNITGGLCDVLNLAEKIMLPSVDCVISLEVGEHIPKEFESIFIDNLCNCSSKLLILSWAVEGQDGEGHVNCRNNDYIRGILESKNYISLPDYEASLRQSSTLSWFKNTIMVFKKSQD